MKKNCIAEKIVRNLESVPTPLEAPQELFGIKITTRPLPKGVIGVIGYPERPESLVWLVENEQTN